jgi:predicted transcriptional regulator
MEFSIKKRWEIIFLHLHKLGPQLSIRAIAKELNCSQDTVKTWIQRYQETGDVQDKERQGRKRKTTEKEDLDIIDISTPCLLIAVEISANVLVLCFLAISIMSRSSFSVVFLFLPCLSLS